MCDSKPTRPPLQPRPAGRLKLWELEPRFHCAVIGTCLTLDDLRQACERAGLEPHTPLADYELHHAFVAMADRPSPAIGHLQKVLERRYRDSVARLHRVAREDWESVWREAVDQGRVAGMFWALLTRADLPLRLRDRIAGDVHMLSHLSGASRREDLQRVPTLERRVASVQRKLERNRQEYQRRHNEQRLELQRLRQRLREAQRAERQLQQAQARIQELERNDLVKRLRTQVECYAAQLADTRLGRERAESALETARRQYAYESESHCRTRALLHQVARERAALEQFVEGELAPTPCAGTATECDLDLCGRCILYVGGRQHVTAHLSRMVQRCNGELICHDGGLEDNRARLAALLPRADAVVCPLDCVSHDAYQRVKRFCKQYAKRLILLPTASLSAFARGLQEIGPVAQNGSPHPARCNITRAD